jgi:hypothetical protein
MWAMGARASQQAQQLVRAKAAGTCAPMQAAGSALLS